MAGVVELIGTGLMGSVRPRREAFTRINGKPVGVVADAGRGCCCDASITIEEIRRIWRTAK